VGGKKQTCKYAQVPGWLFLIKDIYAINMQFLFSQQVGNFLGIMWRVEKKKIIFTCTLITAIITCVSFTHIAIIISIIKYIHANFKP